MNAAPDPHWIARINAVGKAQSRYLWLLLIAALFFAALHASLMDASGSTTLKVPVFDLDLDRGVVLAAGPAIICIFVLLVHGTMRALRAAAHHVDNSLLQSGEMERFDEHPTALDLVIYTTADTRSWIAGLLFLVFPALLLLVLAEAAWLWLSMPVEVTEGVAWRTLRWLTLIVGLPAVGHTILFFKGRLQKWHKGDHVKALRRPAT